MSVQRQEAMCALGGDASQRRRDHISICNKNTNNHHCRRMCAMRLQFDEQPTPRMFCRNQRSAAEGEAN